MAHEATEDIDRLIKRLKDKDSDIRREAAEALEWIEDPRTVEPLIAALKDKDPDVRWLTAGALGKIKDSRAVEPLIAALGDENPDVQQPVAMALEKITGENFGNHQSNWQAWREKNKGSCVTGD